MCALCLNMFIIMHAQKEGKTERGKKVHIIIFFFLYATNINILTILLLLGGCRRMRCFEELKKKKKKLRFWRPGQPVHIQCVLI